MAELWKCPQCGEQETESFCHAHGTSDDPFIDAMPVNPLYGTAEAAIYLRVKPETIKYHVYITKRLCPQLVGKSLVFTQAQLDCFQATRRGPGRPRKETRDDGEL